MSSEAPATRWGVTLLALESISLVVVGIAATKLPSIGGLATLITATLIFVFSRIVVSGPTRNQRSREWLTDYLADRVSLFSALQEVAKYVDSRTWSPLALTSAVQWWMDEDLVSDYMQEEEINRQEQEDAKRDEQLFASWSRQTRKRAIAHRIQNFPLKARLRFYRFERAVNPSLHLIDAAFRLGSEQTARMLLFAAIREGFVSEVVEHRKYGEIRREYQFGEGIMTIGELRERNERYWEEEEPE